MKKLLFVSIFIFCFFAPYAQAYVIDGFIDDWGVNLNASSLNKGYLDVQTPSGGHDIDYVTEDNADIYDGMVYVGPGYSPGNLYDVEAMYFDNDTQHAYLAIVSGLYPEGAEFPPGDIFIDVGQYQDPSSLSYDKAKYGFGIDIESGHLYSVTSWEDVKYSQHGVANPWKMGDERTIISDEIDFVYSSNQNSHYVIEAKIPLALLGLSAQSGDPESHAWMHYTMKCGNDYLNLQGNVTAAPEPATMILFGTGILGLAKLRKK